MWKWDQQEPFGADTPNGDPGNTGTTFDLPLRFPGQYADKETNLSYNYLRDYDPAIGRYAQSDPIGIEGAINTYVYANQRPTGLSDPAGLQAQAAAVACGPAFIFCAAAITAASAGIVGTINAINSSSSSTDDRPSNVIPFPTRPTQDSCKPDDQCPQEKARLEALKEKALEALNSTNVSRGNAVRNYNAFAANINLQIARHNPKCPAHQVDFLPTYRGPASAVRFTGTGNP